MPNLIGLHLSNNNNLNTITGLNTLSELAVLKINDCNFSNIDLANNNKLTNVYLDNNYFLGAFLLGEKMNLSDVVNLPPSIIIDKYTVDNDDFTIENGIVSASKKGTAHITVHYRQNEATTFSYNMVDRNFTITLIALEKGEKGAEILKTTTKTNENTTTINSSTNNTNNYNTNNSNNNSIKRYDNNNGLSDNKNNSVNTELSDLNINCNCGNNTNNKINIPTIITSMLVSLFIVVIAFIVNTFLNSKKNLD